MIWPTFWQVCNTDAALLRVMDTKIVNWVAYVVPQAGDLYNSFGCFDL